MGENKTKSANLSIPLSFHYQCLVGLEQCFTMKDGESIWFEFDGDVSLVNENWVDAVQTEVKMYGDKLTDHHENFWKTLKNWLAPEFLHENYCSLVLLTTQEFGSNALIRNWESKNSSQRYEILNAIYQTRDWSKLESDNLTGVVRYQKAVMETNKEKLLSVLNKITITTQFSNKNELANRICTKFLGIPKANVDAYLHGLIGFIYSQLVNETWEVKKQSFDCKCEELTSTYGLKEFTIPPFDGYTATEDEFQSHERKLFVRKIQDIEYEEVISEAIGNWIELHNSLTQELNGAPQYRNITNKYRNQLIKQFKRKYSAKCRNSNNIMNDSKDLYDDIIGEPPFTIANMEPPPFEYKNGLMQDAMDDQEQELKWKIESQ